MVALNNKETFTHNKKQVLTKTAFPLSLFIFTKKSNEKAQKKSNEIIAGQIVENFSIAAAD